MVGKFWPRGIMEEDDVDAATKPVIAMKPGVTAFGISKI
jgi:hypothetical protein